MSRTKRITENIGWLRHPKTLSQKKMEQAAFEEITESYNCTHNRLRSHQSKQSIISCWDDQIISSLCEVWTKD